MTRTKTLSFLTAAAAGAKRNTNWRVGAHCGGRCGSNTDRIARAYDTA